MSRVMQESGIEWIGSYPATWRIDLLRNFFTERRKKVNDREYPPLSVTKQGIVPQLETAAKSDNNDNRKKVVRGDFVINSRSDRKQSCGLSPLTGSVSLINTVLIPQNINEEFANYLLDNYGFAEEFFRWGHGIVMDLWTTNWVEMSNILLPIPPKEEQSKIATTIKNKLVQINRLIDIQEQQTDKLMEYKKSVISKAVTKGLNPNMSMKDSGIEWIGMIPKHWEISKIKYLSNFRNETNFDSTKKYIALENIVSNSANWINTDNTYDSIGAKVCKKNDVLFGKLRPYLSKSFYVVEDCCCSSEFLVFENPNQNKFLLYLTLSYNFVEIINASTYGSKMPRANTNFIKNLDCPLVPLDEQNEIIEYLDKFTADIDKKLVSINRKIELLQEYKKSLIYEYVTGKKEAS